MNHVPEVLDGRGVRVRFRIRIPVFFEAGFPGPRGCGEVSVVESFRSNSLNECVPAGVIG